jgi:hypothetical protein
MIFPPGENYLEDWVMEVKTTLESSEFGTFWMISGEVSGWVIVVAMLVQSDYF